MNAIAPTQYLIDDAARRKLTITRVLLDRACDEIAEVGVNIDEKLNDKLQDALYLLYIVHEELVELQP